MARKVYYYSPDGSNRLIHFQTEVSQEECQICCGTKEFLDQTDIPEEYRNDHIKMIPLVKANLIRHLTTGKHWKTVEFKVGDEPWKYR
jgi:hypothetical protein